MPEYDNTNSGAIFKNDKKEKPAQPDYTGSINAGGVDYYGSMWVKEDKNGRKYFSVALTPKQAKQEAPKQTVQEAIGIDEDDIPF